MIHFCIENIENSKLWLKSEGLSAPFDAFLIDKWKLTYQIRQADVLNLCRDLSAIFEEWPLIQSPNGYFLVSILFTIDQEINFINIYQLNLG